ncbi:MAG TPA: hypothetical protein VMH38_04400 [Thermoplasmata archaeon]|nr:hypothetical protein [Thermoplasmata archaeon]
MNAGAPSLAGRLRRPPGRLGVYAPWPLVGVTLLLVTLVIFTPVLVLNSHQPGPGILTQAELVVDKTSNNATLHFYVWALGETIRYDAIRIGVATSFNWTGAPGLNWSAVNWTSWNNGTDVLSVMFASSANPVALNISAHYVSPSGQTWYYGLLAFYVSPATSSAGESLYSYSGTSGVTVTSPLAVSNDTLPAVILLADVGPGGPP